MTNTNTNANDFTATVDRYIAVWSITDPDDRAKAVSELWAADGAEFIEGKQYFGHAALTERVTEAHEAFIAGGAYLAAGGDDATRHDDVVVFTIRLDHAAGPEHDTAWSSRVFLLLDDDGRVLADYQLTVQPLVAA
ncbi:MAG: hypothetical protein HOV87_07795 [Catenulispora sp.]|nr:hypothetical protein [Catenulispora sp.]